MFYAIQDRSFIIKTVESQLAGRGITAGRNGDWDAYQGFIAAFEKIGWPLWMLVSGN